MTKTKKLYGEGIKGLHVSGEKLKQPRGPMREGCGGGEWALLPS